MALDKSVFRTRSTSAAIFVAVMAIGFLSRWTFFLVFSVVHFGCWIEFQRLVEKIDPQYRKINPFHRYGVMLAGWGLMLFNTAGDIAVADLQLFHLGFWLGLSFVFLLPVVEILFSNPVSLRNIAYSVVGLVYISFSLSTLVQLLTFPYPFRSSVLMPLIVILCMWINDTMAYIVGSVMGQTPFSPISPKKTWEGTVGGVVLTVIIISIVSRLIPAFAPFNILHFVVIPLIAAIAGVLGDLLESKLKRMAGVKDSGTLLPGHGGFLDRFDSLLLAAPCVWLYLSLLKMI